MLERLTSPHEAAQLSQPDMIAEKPKWQIAGERIAEFLYQQKNPQLLLDVDGVILQGDNLLEPELISNSLIPAIVSLEQQGVNVGLATSRPIHALEFLRSQSTFDGSYAPQLVGPNILEHGHVIVTGDKVELTGHPNHQNLIKDFQRVIKGHDAYRDSWEKVQKESTDEQALLCEGNYQWQGESFYFVWFYDANETITDEQVTNLLEPVLRDLSEIHEMDYDKHLYIDIGRMNVGNNLVFVGIKGKDENGNPINKGTPAHLLPEEGWVFAADGFGDTPMAILTKAKGGKIIGIGGNMDKSDEPNDFLETADAVVEDPHEFANALLYAAHLLANKPKKAA